MFKSEKNSLKHLFFTWQLVESYHSFFKLGWVFFQISAYVAQEFGLPSYLGRLKSESLKPTFACK